MTKKFKKEKKLQLQNQDIVFEFFSRIHQLDLEGIDRYVNKILDKREGLIREVKRELAKAKTLPELLELFKKLRQAKTYYILVTYVFPECFSQHILELNLQVLNISLFDFITAVDRRQIKKIQPQNNRDLFNHLVKFYKLIKKWKQKAYKDKKFLKEVHYSDFYELYDELLSKIKQKLLLKQDEDILFQILKRIRKMKLL